MRNHKILEDLIPISKKKYIIEEILTATQIYFGDLPATPILKLKLNYNLEKWTIIEITDQKLQ